MNAFDVLDGLLVLEQNRKGISEFFLTNEVKRVIVYGLGRVGIRAISAIRDAGVQIVCVVDKDAKNIETDEFKVISLSEITEFDNNAELIVVTVSDYYYEIKEELEPLTNLDIISIGEIVEYCMDGERNMGINVVRKSTTTETHSKNLIDKECRSRKILVFGGGSGIGKSIALKMLKDGADVVIAGRTKSKLQTVIDEYEDFKKNLNNEYSTVGNLFALRADISKIENHGKFFDYASNFMGGLDAFVNAAAVSLEQRGRGYEPWDITEGEWDEIANTDFKAAFFLMRNEVDYFCMKNSYGNILNISSNAFCMDIIGLYGASKLAIMRWTRSFGKRYGREGIVINAIAPGITYTPFVSSYAKTLDQPFSRHAINRFIRPDEIAELAHFCLKEKGVILCGTTIIADGGDMNAI